MVAGPAGCACEVVVRLQLVGWGQAKWRGDFAFQLAVGSDADGNTFHVLHSFVQLDRRAPTARAGAGAIMWVNSIAHQIGKISHWLAAHSLWLLFFLSLCRSLRRTLAASPRDLSPAHPLNSPGHPSPSLSPAISHQEQKAVIGCGRPPFSPQLLFFRFVVISLTSSQSVPNLFIIIKLSKKRLCLTAAGALSLPWIIHASRHRNESL